MQLVSVRALSILLSLTLVVVTAVVCNAVHQNHDVDVKVSHAHPKSTYNSDIARGTADSQGR